MSLTQTLEMMAKFRRVINPPYNYSCIEDYVLDRGVDQTLSEALTKEELGTLLDAIDSRARRFQKRQCFYNSQLMTLHNEELKYVEGHAVGRSGMLVHHAWLTLNGKLIDLTWRTDKPNHRGRLRDRIFGVIPSGWEYRGIEFPRDRILERIVETDEARAFLGDWQRACPHLRQERLEK